MAGMTPTSWAEAMLTRLGYPVTPGGVHALLGWQQAEGGFGHKNPLNTTQQAPGATTFNSIGVKSYPDWETSLDATAATLKNGRYNPILNALKTGNAAAAAQAIGASPWGTNGSLVAKTISAAAGAKVPAATTSPGRYPAPTVASPAAMVDNSGLRRQVVQDFLAAGGVKSSAATAALAQGYTAARDTPGAPASAPAPSAPGLPGVGGGISPHARPGDPVVSSKQSEGGLHQTDGLPGFPAHDYFAPAGSHAVAPIGGTVVKLSGHDPAEGPPEGPGGPLGWSVYVRGDDGRTYFLTHLGSRDVKVGEKVKQGQVIGTVANYDKYGRPSHIHMGVNG